MKKTRRRLSDVNPRLAEVLSRPSTPGPPNELLDIPDFLDRKLWNEEDHKRNREAWNKITQDERERIRLANQRIFAVVKRERQRKMIRRIKSDERAQLKAERRARRIRRNQEKDDNDQRVLDALKNRCDTVGKVHKRTKIETRLVSRSLKRLVAAGKVTKPSPRTYKLVVRTRKRLSDVIK